MWEYRDELVNIIQENVQICQSKFGGRTILATESEPSVLKIINAVELILQDGLKVRNTINLKNINLNVNPFSLRQVTELVSNGISMVMGPVNQDQPVFWHFVRNHLTRHEQDRYYHLQNVVSDYGRGRSWLRSSINEHSLDRYLKMLFSDQNLITSYYESSALINDVVSQECLVKSARDLRPVIFALIVDRKELDQCDELKLFFVQSVRPEPKAIMPKPTMIEPVKRVKKTKVRVVDLETDDVETEKVTSSFNTIAISIPENSHEMPSLKLHCVGSSPSMQSIDSQDVPCSELRHSSFNSSEMRLMLLDLTEKKNQLEEVKSSLQLQLHEVQVENQEVTECYKTMEKKNEELNRENTILREQLKQYMSVVQMLKTNGTKTETSSVTPPPDYHQEASYFEDRLIQVAEMHGELMEFNSHLQSRLQAVECLVNRFRNELVHLRGPLPSDYLQENGSIVNNIQIEYPLIHIWIPSTFLVHGKVDSHHVYQIYVRLKDTEWTIFKRYSQIYKFRKELKEQYPYTLELNFPPKKNFGQRDQKIVDDRRIKLQDFFRQFLNLWTKNEPTAISMLTKTSFVQMLPFFSEQQ